MSSNTKRKFDQAFPEPEPKATENVKSSTELEASETMHDQVKADLDLSRVEQALQVKILDYLGEGKYGDVYACESLQDGQKYAVKVMSSKHLFDEDKRLEWEIAALNEIDSLVSLEHDNILKYYDHALLQHHEHQANCYMAIKTELLDCTLGQILKKRQLTVPQVEHLLRSLGSAILFMVEEGYVHQDIKPDNIMFKNLDLNAEDFDAAFMKAIPKLNDFGFAKQYMEDHDKALETIHFCGSPFYCSPEKLSFRDDENDGFYPFLADAYAFGVTLLVCLRPPKAKDPTAEDKEIRKMFSSHYKRIHALNLYRQRHPQEARSPILKAIEKLIEDLEFVGDVINSL